MLSLKLNDAAAAALGGLDGRLDLTPPGGLAAGLRRLAARGIVRRGQVLMFPGFSGNPDHAPAIFRDLTGWECAHSSFHLEDDVPQEKVTTDAEGAPTMSEDDQRVLLMHGAAFALEFSRHVHALSPPAPVRCIVAVNETNGTFRFHQIRRRERWNHADLDSYPTDKVIELDIEPAAPEPDDHAMGIGGSVPG